MFAKKLTIFIMIGFMACIITYSCNSVSAEEYSIPNWIKNPAKWWHDGKIYDSDFVLGMQYLLNQEIIKIPQTTTFPHFFPQTPSWIKTTAGEWAADQISDEEFLQGIQYLVLEGTINTSSQPSPEFVIGQEQFLMPNDQSVQGASYVIFKSGSTYDAKDGTTNTIEFSGTNATIIVQSAINSLSSNGGSIIFESGTFPVSIMVTKSNLTFEGQGYSTILSRDGDKSIFNIIGKSLPNPLGGPVVGPHSVSRIVIKNMEILGDSSKYQTDCISAKETSLMTFDTLQILGCYGNGIYFEEVWDSRILNSYISWSGNQAQDKAALYLYSGTTDNTNNIYVENCDFEAQQGDDVISRGLDLKFRNNHELNFLSDKFESHSNLVKHHLNFDFTEQSIIEASLIISASDSNAYVGQNNIGITFIGNFFTNNPYPPITPATYNIDTQGSGTIVMGNFFGLVNLAHINIGPSATSTHILGNQYNLSNGLKAISGNVQSVVQ
jgi:hypothetical protein